MRYIADKKDDTMQIWRRYSMAKFAAITPYAIICFFIFILFIITKLKWNEVILKKIELIEKIKKYLLSYFANLSIIFFRLTSARKLL